MGFRPSEEVDPKNLTKIKGRSGLKICCAPFYKKKGEQERMALSVREVIEMTSIKVISSKGEQLGDERGATALFNGFPWAIESKHSTKVKALKAANTFSEKVRRVLFIRVGQITSQSSGKKSVRPFWAVLSNLKSRVVRQRGFTF